MNKLLILILTPILWVTTSCISTSHIKDQDAGDGESEIENIDYELYLVGNLGTTSNDLTQSDIVELIKQELTKNDVEKSVVFLGNSFSSNGFPDEESDQYHRLNEATEKCLKELNDNTERLYFIPGNTEWYDGHDYTLSALQDVEDYIESKAGDKNIFVPSNGCGEPKVVKLTKDLILLIIDSQWVLQGDRSSERKRSGCDIDTESELVTYIQQVLSKNKNKNVIITAHHPVYSDGLTGGNFPALSHLLPLPIVGSLINGIKKINGGPQKIGHPQYEAYRSIIQSALGNFEGVIHASAHDHNLQYHHENDHHYIIAGSGNKTNFVRQRGTADFALESQGFAKITHTKNLELWLEFYIPDPNGPKQPISVYKKRIYKKEQINFEDKDEYPDLSSLPKSKKIIASTTYAQKKVGMGQTYRKEWGTEVDVPVLLLDEVHGGLIPVQQGGGFQTKSLRLENSQGQQWVLRSVDKDATKVVPTALRNTFFQDLLQDGISASHPYGALAIPKMAEAAQIYHANPSIVWLPKQKALGDYNHSMAEKVFLFEERPGGNMSGHQTYGGATKSINTPELIEKLKKNHKHIVDQEYVLKARLFDLLIGDWDRHDDQWRWGIYTDDKIPNKKIYRAIPRDRDQVFFKNDGWINYIASRPYFTPSLRKFNDEIDFISGLSFNARHFDRHFISQLNKQDFIRIAKDLQNNITDESIKKAIKSWHKDIYDINGESIVSKLISRRNHLLQTALDFYRYLSKEVTVAGTYGHNTFDVTTKPNNILEVRVYHNDNDKEHLIWSRDIEGGDCQELRLFGLKKSDSFNFYGDHPSSIKVRVIGGSGDDIVNNRSSKLKIIVYDRDSGMKLTGLPVKNKLKDQKGVNRYDRKDWKINRTIHFPMLSFYTDEGLGLNYNIWWQRNGFRKNPYQSNHMLNVGYYFANTAFVGTYSGHWTSVFGPDWDLRMNASFTGPTFAQYFYGLGNTYNNFAEIFPDNPSAGSIDFHIVRGTHVDINPQIIKDLGGQKTFSINPTLELINYDNDPLNTDQERFIFTEEAGRLPSDFGNKIYTGLGLHYTNERLNNKTIPTRGYKMKLGAEYRQSLSDAEFSHVTVSSDIAAYIPFSPSHRVVLATNIGGAYTLGDYEFFHANYLANPSRLRGFKTNRFAGDGIVYHATDLRIKLFQGNGNIKTGLGIFGSFDYGRAFLEDEAADRWHTSYGAGIYLTPLDIIGFRLGYFIGQEDTQVTIGGSLAF